MQVQPMPNQQMMMQQQQPQMMQPGMMQPGMMPVMVQPVGDLLTAVLAPHGAIHISQRMELGGCCNVQNVYTVQSSSAINREGFFGAVEGSEVLFVAREDSDCCTRLCCNPLHGLKLHLEQFNPMYGPGIKYTLERPGCCSKPGLACCACTDGCTDEMRMHSGLVPGDAGSMDQSNLMFTAKQAPAAESMFEPVINITAPGATAPTLSVRGPTFFGGWSELCCSSEFPVTAKAQDGTPYQSGLVMKLAPNSVLGCCREACTPADNFAVIFTPETRPEDKAPMVVAAFLADYMLFESDNGLCQCKDNGDIVCTLCMCYCAGCIIPCNVYLKKPQN